MPAPESYQTKVREGNRWRVLSALKPGKMRFSEIQEKTGLSPKALRDILVDFEEEGKTKRAMKGRWPGYDLTKKGRQSFSQISTLGLVMDQIQEEKGGEYFHDYSRAKKSMDLSGLVWGIQDDVVINRKIDEKIGYVLEKIIRNTHLDIYSQFQDVDLDKIKDGKILLGFVIEVGDFIKSIKEKSVENYNKMHSKSKRKPKGKYAKAEKEFMEFEKI